MNVQHRMAGRHLAPAREKSPPALPVAATRAVKWLHSGLRRAAWALALVLGVGVAQGAPSSAADEPIRIGQSLALTGPLADIGNEFRDGAQAYIGVVNSQGGVNGRRVELISLDDGYVVDRTRENVQRLVNEDKVLALFGVLGTANVASVLPQVERDGIPLIAPYTGAAELRKFNRNIFWLRASYSDETEKLVEHLTNLGLNRIAVFYQNDAFGQSGINGLEAALRKRNLEVVAKGSFERNTVDVAAAAKTIAAANPQVVLMVSTYKPTIAFVRELRRQGAAPQLYALSVIGVKTLIEQMGPEANGVAITQVVPYPDANTPAYREMQKLPPNLSPKAGITYASLEGYLAAKVLVEGLRRAGGPITREKLVTGLESLRNYDAGGLILRYSPNDHDGSHFVDLTIVGNGGKLIR